MEGELLDWLYARQAIQPGMERVRALIGAPPPFRVVLVGGTNGKGSVTASLDAAFRAAGIPTGRFISPHLSRFSERFQVNGEEVADAAIAQVLAELRPQAEQLGASFFEIVTACAVRLFAKAAVRWAVMEVGLGGRLDATNALDPALSLITQIGLDHTQLLGGTLASIAGEKAGILRPGRPALTAARGEALEVIARRAAELGAPLHTPERTTWSARSLGWSGWEVQLESAAGRLRYRTALLGTHGLENSLLAALAAQLLGLPGAAISSGLAATRWPGRLERIAWGERELILDGAHNPAGAAALARALISLAPLPLPLIFGASSDKDLAGLLRPLLPLASRIILTRALHSTRAADPADLLPLCQGKPVQVAASPEQALQLLSPQEHLAVVAGSLYLVGEIRALLLGGGTDPRRRSQ